MFQFQKKVIDLKLDSRSDSYFLRWLRGIIKY